MINQFQSSELRFIILIDNTKRPLEANWTTTNNYPYSFIKEAAPINYGVALGFGKLIVIDVDRKGKDYNSIIEKIKALLPETFTIKTGNDGRHFYYYSDDIIKGVPLIEGNGEIRSTGQQVVAPNSIVNGKKYEIENDKPIAKTSLAEIQMILNQWLPKQEIIEEKLKQKVKDIDLAISDVYSVAGMKKHGEEYYGVHPTHGSTGGMNFWVNPAKNSWHCFRCNSGGGALQLFAVLEGIIDCTQTKQLKGEKFRDAVKQVEQKTGKNYALKKIEKPTSAVADKVLGGLVLKDLNYFSKLKKDKRFLVEGVIYPKTVSMLFSPPAQFKSLVANHLAMAIASGKQFMGLKSKKYPVIFCDKENNEQILKDRLQRLCKGHGIRKRKIPLWFITQHGDLLNTTFFEALKKEIMDRKAKLVIFDTLHRFADYEENAADDINKIYTEVFQPIVNNCDCAVLFLHHTTKDGQYRGSSDLMGMLDTAYAVKRKGKSEGFVLVCEKSRFGELENIHGSIDFADEYIKVCKADAKEVSDDRVSVLMETTDRIKTLFPIIGHSIFRKDIVSHFEMLKDFKTSSETVKRSLRWLVVNDFLERGKKGEYVRKWRGNN